MQHTYVLSSGYVQALTCAKHCFWRYTYIRIHITFYHVVYYGWRLSSGKVGGILLGHPMASTTLVWLARLSQYASVVCGEGTVPSLLNTLGIYSSGLYIIKRSAGTELMIFIICLMIFTLDMNILVFANERVRPSSNITSLSV